MIGCPIPNKVMSELATRVPLRVLPYAPGALAAVRKAVPYYRETVIRTGAIQNLDHDTAQVAVVNVLATHARVLEVTVRETVAATVASTDELGRVNPLFRGLAELFTPLRTEGAAAVE